MSVVGSVSVRVVPSFSGMQRTISRQFTGAGQQAGQQLSRSMAASMDMRAIGGAIQGVGDRMSALGGRLTKSITVPAAGAAAAVGGVVAAFGWGRLKSVDSAQAQLRGLGYSTEDVTRISEQLTDALEGGMLTMGEATSAAAAGMAAGVEEGAELTRYIQLLDAATAGSNGTFDEMNQIFARIQGSGRLMTNELDMIEQRMPGFSGAAAEHFGVSQEAMREMVSAGEVSADDFLDIMDSFAGDMATEYAKSWEGMVQNTKAYIGILGENLLGGVFEQSKEALAEFIEYLSSDEVERWATRAGEAIGNAFSSILRWVRDAIEWWTNLDGSTQRLIVSLAGIAVAIGPVLLVGGRLLSMFGGLVSAIGGVVGWFSRLLTPLLASTSSMTLLGRALVIGQRAFSALTGPIGLIIGVLIGVWTASEDFREAVMNLASAIWDSLVDAFERIWEQLGGLWDAFTDLWGTLTEGDGIFDSLGGVLAVVVDLFAEILPIIIDIGVYIIETLIGGLEKLVETFNWLVEVLDGPVTAVLDWMAETGLPAVGEAATWLWENAISPAVDHIDEGFGRIKTSLSNLGEQSGEVTVSIAGDFTTLEGELETKEARMAITLWNLRDQFKHTRRDAVVNFSGTALSFGQMVNDIGTAVKTGFASAIVNKDEILRTSKRLFDARVDGMTANFLTFAGSLGLTVRTIVRAAWSQFIEDLGSARDRFRERVGNIKDAWDGLGLNIFSTVDGSMRRSLVLFGTTLMDDLRRRIRTAVIGIGVLWESIKQRFAEPINWVIRVVVNDGLIGAFNKVAGFIPGVSDIPPVKEIETRAKGGPVRAGQPYLVGEEGPEFITPSRDGWVHTADQTRDMQNSGLGIGGGELSWRERALVRLAPGAYRTGQAVEEVGDWVRGGLKSAVESMLKPIFNRADRWASGRGIVAEYGVGMTKKVRDEILGWAEKDDEEYAASMAGGFYDGPFTANPGGFNRPMQGPITSRAGTRSYWGAFGNQHYGVDIGGPIGTAVRAMFSGVIRAISGGGNNRTVVMGHGGYDTAYMHMSAITRALGEQVSGGDIIARSGTAGSGPHGHFEYHPGGYYNPSMSAINSLIRDKGGLIYPGMNQIYNGTGGAEYAFNQRQFDNLNRIAESSNGGEGWTINQNNYNSGSQYKDAQDLRMTFRRERRKAGV